MLVMTAVKLVIVNNVTLQKYALFANLGIILILRMGLLPLLQSSALQAAQLDMHKI